MIGDLVKKTARKKKVAKKVEPKKPSILDRLPKNEGEHIELLIQMTEKRIKNPVADKFLADQAVRLKAKLAEWRKANSK